MRGSAAWVLLSHPGPTVTTYRTLKIALEAFCDRITSVFASQATMNNRGFISRDPKHFFERSIVECKQRVSSEAREIFFLFLVTDLNHDFMS